MGMTASTLQNSCNSALPHIGSRLQAERVRRGMLLSAVAKKLNIQTNYLQAIEGLDKDALPSLGYVLGYLRSYALHLGMDAGDVIASYKADIECPKNLGIRNRPHHVPKRKIRIPKGSFAAGIVFSSMLVVVSWYGWKSDAHSAQPIIEPVEQVRNWSVAPTQAIQNNSDSITLVAVGPSWVQVRDASGALLISRIMLPGEVFETTNQSHPLLSLRDAGAIELYRAGKRIGPIGQKGASGENIPLVDTSL